MTKWLGLGFPFFQIEGPFSSPAAGLDSTRRGSFPPRFGPESESGQEDPLLRTNLPGANAAKEVIFKKNVLYIGN